MIKSIHDWVSQYIHIPTNLEKLILFLLLAWLSFQMESVNIAICAICGLTAVLHVVDIIGRVKGNSGDGDESSGEDSDGDSNLML